MASSGDAGGEEWSPRPTKIAAGFLPRDRCLLEGLAVHSDEVHEHVGRMRGDAVGVAGTPALDRLADQFPDDVDLRAPDRGKHVGDRVHPAIARRRFLGDIVLDHQPGADHLDIDDHGAAIIGRRDAGADKGRAGSSANIPASGRLNSQSAISTLGERNVDLGSVVADWDRIFSERTFSWNNFR